MRPLEIALIVLVAALLLLSPRWPRWRIWLAAGAIGVLIAHLVVEGARWQMALAYLLTIVAVGWSLLLPGERRRSGWGIFGRIIALTLLSLSAAAALVLPVPTLQGGSGPYTVGTMALHAIDPVRTEQYGPDSTAPREIMIQLWYPANPDSDAAQAPFSTEPEKAVAGLADTLGLPPLILSHINLLELSALDAPAPAISDAPYPLLLFSHGWSGFRTQSTFLMDELASHGYVVASVDHPYDAAFVIFPDGRAVYNDPGVLGADDPDFVQRRNQLVRTRAADLGLAIDALAEQAAGQSKLSGMIDFGRIGVLGHSTGGGAAMEFCGSDDRCTAALGLDTWVEPTSDAVIDAGLSQPVFMQFSETWPWAENVARVDTLLANSSGPSRVMTIADTAHWDFTDIPLLTPLANWLGFKGPLDGDRVMAIINAYSVAFLDQVLKDGDGVLLAGDSAEYPEVQFDTIQPNP